MNDRLILGQVRLERFQLMQHGYVAAEGARFRPPTDVFETEDAIVVIVEVAGLREDQLEVSLSAADQVLTVAGRRQSYTMEAGKAIFHQLEIAFGAFAVDIPVPAAVAGAGSATAEYNDGFLTITLRKTR